MVNQLNSNIVKQEREQLLLKNNYEIYLDHIKTNITKFQV